MKHIPLTQGKEALVSDCDYRYLMQWKWCVSSAGYAVRGIETAGKCCSILMHRAIAERAGFSSPKEIDHWDGNPLNNQRANLRPATRQQNMANHGPQRNNTSGYKGVYWDKNRLLWLASIKVTGQARFLGRWSTNKAAARPITKPQRNTLANSPISTRYDHASSKSPQLLRLVPLRARPG